MSKEENNKLICKTCVHSIFDELWGEYKCRKRECVIYYPEFFNGCEYYEEEKK